MLLSVTSGQENFDGIGTSKFYSFFVPSRLHPGTEVHLNVKGKSGVSVKTQGAPQTFLAAPGFIEDFGKWTNTNYDCADGVVVKVFAQLKRSNVSRPMSVNQLIRVRERAAMRRLTFRTLGWEKGAFSEVHVSGRFDLINVDDARRLGCFIVFE